MGLPSITISFKEKGITAIERGQRSIILLIMEDSTQVEDFKQYTIYSTADIPEELDEATKEQIQLALIGYINAPFKIIANIYKKGELEEGSKISERLKAIENTKFTYLVVPQITEEEIETVSSWVKSMRTTKDICAKAVLPNADADNEGVINFTNKVLKTKTKSYTTAEYCSRIAGLIAGTPQTISCTYAPLPELVEVDNLTKEELDAKIDAGEFVLFNDGEKIKVARGVNSFVTTIQDKGKSFKKVKLVELMDMIHDDIKKTAQDSYLGKYANSYNNRCLLLAAINGYFKELEQSGLLEEGQNNAYIDLEATKTYLLENGRNTKEELESMNEATLKVQNVGDTVFLMAVISLLDAIEEIHLPIQI